MDIGTRRDVKVNSGLLLSPPDDSMVEFEGSNPGGCASGHDCGQLHRSVQRVEMTLVSGTHFGSYEVLRPLGAGGMGEVYLARDQRLERNVAIKVLPEEFTTDAVSVRRFEREAKTASALNHPNIVTIYEI